jgi:hypothetical protein
MLSTISALIFIHRNKVYPTIRYIVFYRIGKDTCGLAHPKVPAASMDIGLQYLRTTLTIRAV